MLFYYHFSIENQACWHPAWRKRTADRHIQKDESNAGT